MVQKVETIPIVCVLCPLSVGERQRINPACSKERSTNYQNCEIFKYRTSKKMEQKPKLRTREQLEWLVV